MLVAPGIHRIEALLGERLLCVYLLIGKEHIMLVDSGLDSTPSEHILPYLRQVAGARPIDYVLTTHADFDHIGGNGSIREMFPNASFMGHKLDRRWIENIELLLRENYGQFENHGLAQNPEMDGWIRTQVRTTDLQQELLGGEIVSLDSDWHVRILHTPGHTRGHLSILDPRSNTMIIADAALSDGLYTRDGTAMFPPTYRFLQEYLQSAKCMLDMAPATLLTSHYPTLLGQSAATFLHTTHAFTRRFHDELINLLGSKKKPVSGMQLTSELCPRLGSWPDSNHSFLLYPLLAHLEDLEQLGQVRKSYRSSLPEYEVEHDE